MHNDEKKLEIFFQKPLTNLVTRGIISTERGREITLKRKELTTMMTLKIRHNYCGMETYITGDNVMDAMRKANKDIKVWTVVEVEYND